MVGIKKKISRSIKKENEDTKCMCGLEYEVKAGKDIDKNNTKSTKRFYKYENFWEGQGKIKDNSESLLTTTFETCSSEHSTMSL